MKTLHRTPGGSYDRLTAHFGTQSVFMDVDAITPGMDFETLIESKLQSSAVMIVLIGKAWLTALNSSGSVRLQNQADFVRREIAAALSRNILVVPVLVGGAIMPRPQDLPDLITPLARLQALQISDSRFHKDIGDLISILESRSVAPRISNISGDWIAEVPKIQEDGKSYELRFTFITAGDDLRGTVSRDRRFRVIYFGYGRINDGKIEGDNIYFEVETKLDKGGYIDGRYQEQLEESITAFKGG